MKKRFSEEQIIGFLLEADAGLRDECLNEHWFPNLLHARTEIER